MTKTFQSNNTCWVYANNADQAFDRVNGIEVYDPWFSEEGAIMDKNTPDAVKAGEKLYQVITQTVIIETDVIANPK